MTQKIIKVGSSVAVVIPKEVSEKYNLKSGTSVDFNYSKKGELIYTPIKPVRAVNHKQEKVTQITMNFINRYRKDLEALKDK